MPKKIDPFPGTLTVKTCDRRYQTKTGKIACQRSRALEMNDTQREWLCRWFPEVENSILASMMGISQTTLHRFARDLKLTKSEKGLRGIKKRQAAHIKKVCEKNGWYDSMRGRMPSEACRKASAKMWDEIHEGKRDHPFKIMRRKNPRKYQKCMQRKSEQRKETIRREMQRVVYGLERKTRLKCIVMYKFTISQLNHRSNALKRGYIIMQDCSEQSGERYNIYYDELTERSALFEKNLIADGFTLKEWPGADINDYQNPTP